MEKKIILKQIAEKAYDIGFGAKKNFATYDISQKIPGFINFISLSIGILGLFIETFTVKHISASLIILGIISLYVSPYTERNEIYEKNGVASTKLFNELKKLYYKIQSSDDTDYDTEIKELKRIENEFYSQTISKQILFSDWYAHYKFFWQHQINWIDEELNFKFWRDKIPLSAFIVSVTIFLIILA